MLSQPVALTKSAPPAGKATHPQLGQVQNLRPRLVDGGNTRLREGMDSPEATVLALIPSSLGFSST